MNRKNEKELSFWEHLEDLRKTIFSILVVLIVVMIVIFVNKELIFNIVLAPQKDDFIIYRLFCRLAEWTSIAEICPESFRVELINTQLASQFFIHLSVSFCMALVLSFPYILYQLFRFVSPALRDSERRYSFGVICYSSLLFYMGVLLNYFLIFPLSFRFLGTYQVSSEVVNLIDLSSYINTLILLSLMIGIMAELPVLSWLLGKLGLLSAAFMRNYRRHAAVIILIIAAVITPTVDIFTLFLVFSPIYLLYELSIFVVARTAKQHTAITA
ncbi:MAG: twin-arginine translocase subunit TatC [Prevotellaceae bacterium]|jgi:sec-independent protein translocase protein TatC|nr:twin-arginine translocase subunit TatC [Prevotellaceae bacterium]